MILWPEVWTLRMVLTFPLINFINKQSTDVYHIQVVSHYFGDHWWRGEGLAKGHACKTGILK